MQNPKLVKYDRLSSMDFSDRRIGVGELAEFELVFRTYWAPILRSLQRLLGDPEEAQDLALETFLRLRDHPQLLEKDSQLQAWLFRVALNLGYNALRSRRRRLKYEGEAAWRELHEKPDVDPERLVVAAAERAQVRQVLGSMKARPALLLFLRHTGYSYAELAQIFEVSPGSIGSLLARAERDFERRYRAAYGA